MKEKSLEKTIKCLKENKVIIYPSESCYSFGCKADSKIACEKIHDLKQESHDKSLIVLVSDTKQLEQFGTMNHIAHTLAKNLMPGKITLVVDRHNKFNPSQKTEIAFRIPARKEAFEICKQLDAAITTTSLNISGEKPIYKIAPAKQKFQNKVCTLLDAGDLDENNQVSTMYDTRSQKILREGPVTGEQIDKVLAEDIGSFFNPKSIAIIGASKDSQKVGHQILKNIILGGFNGKIYPINLKEKRILGHTAYPKVTNIQGKIDLAIIAIPAKFVPKVLQDCTEKKIKNAVIISAGFSEIHSEEGKLLEQKIEQIAAEKDIKILGPNCLGFISGKTSLNATFASSVPHDGHLAIISQSGALGAAMLDWAKKTKIGISSFVSLGNKINLDENDLLRLIEHDPNTKLALIYLEDTKNGRLLMERLRKVASQKPVIIIKGGRTKKGQKAALSHTGALASSTKIFISSLKQSGVILASNLEQAFDITATLYQQFRPSGKNLVILTNAGGPGIVATDLASQYGLNVSKPSEETLQSLKKFLPSAAGLNNPIDVLGDASANTYRKTLKKICDDNNFDSVLVLLTPQTTTQVAKTAKEITKISQKTDKLVLVSFIGGEKVSAGKKILLENGVPSFDFPDQAIEVLAKIIKKDINTEKTKAEINPAIIQKISKIIVSSPLDRNFQIARTFGLPVTKTELVRSKEELSYVAKSIGYPLVLKTLSKKIVHKKFAGGVILDIKSYDELNSTYEKISKKFGPEVSVSPFVSDGFEFYIGGKRDPLFGPVVLFGLGGNYVEGIDDIVLRVFPISKKGALEMINEIHAHKIVKNLDQEKLADLIIKTGQLLESIPQISEIDLNPVKTTKNNAIILDPRIVTKPTI